MTFSDPISGKCQRCNEHSDALIKWVGEGSALDIAHGFYDLWCLRCATEVQLEHAIARVDDIKRLATELAELGGPAQWVNCGPFFGRGHTEEDVVYRSRNCILEEGHEGDHVEEVQKEASFGGSISVHTRE